MIVENIDKYGIDDIYSYEYINNIERAKKTYNSIESQLYDGAYDKALNYIMGIGGYTELSLLIQALGDKEFSFGNTPNGSNALLHYLNNSGKDFAIDPTIPLGSVKVQRGRFYDQMNSMLTMAENTVIPGKSYSFITTKNTDDTWFVNYHTLKTNQNQPAMDWWLALGGARNGMKANINCTTDTMGVKYYTANVTYYLYDFYDWNEETEKELADLHKYGKAQCFRQYGDFSFTLHWTEGSRYPVSSHDERYGNLSIVKFEGIDDNSTLEKCFSKSLYYYDSNVITK